MVNCQLESAVFFAYFLHMFGASQKGFAIGFTSHHHRPRPASTQLLAVQGRRWHRNPPESARSSADRSRWLPQRMEPRGSLSVVPWSTNPSISSMPSCKIIPLCSLHRDHPGQVPPFSSKLCLTKKSQEIETVSGVFPSFSDVIHCLAGLLLMAKYVKLTAGTNSPNLSVSRVAMIPPSQMSTLPGKGTCIIM